MARAAAITIELRTKELARRLMWGQAHSEIMGELGLTYNQFHSIVTSPAFRDELRHLQMETYRELDDNFREELETVQSRARTKSLPAIDVLIKLMESSASENLRRDCAKDIIEYSGQGDASKRPVIQIGHATIALIKQAAIEDDARGRTIDIDAKQ